MIMTCNWDSCIFLLFSNTKHVYDRMLNFLLFKMIFVGAVMDPAWIRLSIWIAILGFLRIFSLLSRDRFDHVRKYQQCPPSASASAASPSHALTRYLSPSFLFSAHHAAPLPAVSIQKDHAASLQPSCM